MDYITRTGYRLEAARLLFDRKSFADVVRECQELVELSLKALLHMALIETPHLHDVGPLLLEQLKRLPISVQPHASALAKISKSLRRDRELAFYGSQDITPSDFYKEEDARKALDDAAWVQETCQSAIVG